jgi:hypothetical protein
VDFDNGVGFKDKVVSLGLTADAVEKAGRKAADTINRYLAQRHGEDLGSVTSSDASNILLGGHQQQVHVSSQGPWQCGGDANCNTGDLRTGANIYLNLHDLETFGSGLVLHEFGHTFTNRVDENGVNHPGEFNGNASRYSFFGTDQAKREQIANLINYSSLQNPASSASESTANAFAAWTTGQYKAAGFPSPISPVQASLMVDSFFASLVTDHLRIP